MFRLGLRLTLAGGREALIRLLVMALAVTIGVAILCSVLAVFHGYQTASNKPCFEIGNCMSPAAQNNSKTVLALYRRDAYKGVTITRLDLAKSSDYSIAIPGVAHMPQAGEYYASPGMAKLLEQAPADELGNRYPGKQVGTIGEAGLHNPDERVIIIGRNAADISSLSDVVPITSIEAPSGADSNATFLQFVTALGAVALLFPMFILIGSATRMGAARREERYAAFRLVGATPRQINVIAATDVFPGSIVGVVTGIGLFFALQPLLADLTFTGGRLFTSDVWPAAWEIALIAVGVPVVAGITSFLSLRRVKISPLGVSRKATPPPPRLSSLLPLALGILLFAGAVMVAPSDDPPFLAVPGLLLIMAGLIVGGPWLTVKTAHAAQKLTDSASALLASRRLADNPKAAFRAVSGLVLVVLVASLIAGFVPAALTQRLAPENNALSNTMTAVFLPGMNESEHFQPAEGAQLLQRLQGISGVEVFPVYSDPTPAESGQDMPPGGGPPTAIIACGSLEKLEALGSCPAGVQAITISNNAFNDMMLQHQIGSVITQDSNPRSIDPTSMSLLGLLVQASNASALEKARTMLSLEVVAPVGDALLTFGETREATEEAMNKLQAIVSAAIIIALITAGASVALAVASGMIERRRPFTLLRLTGVPLSSLYKVVLLEAAIPLIGATLVAAAIGFGAAAFVIAELAPESANVRFKMPDLPYLLALAAGPVVALLVVVATLPLVGRLTKPDNGRFE